MTDCVAGVHVRAGYGRGCIKGGAAFVEGEGYVAVLAVEGVFASGTEDEVAVAAAVQEEYGLFVSCEDLFQLCLKFCADETRAACAEPGGHINQQHLRHGQVHDALRESNQLIVLFSLAICKCFE